MSRIVVATDGSSLGNPGPSGWAWIVRKDCWAAGGLPRATNQAAELFAVLSALRAIPVSVPIHIRTDSQYTLKSCSVWLPGWKRNGWRRANGAAVMNLPLMKEIERLLSVRKDPVTWEWVKGHSGNRMNEAADARCTAAARAVQDGLVVPGGPGWTGVRAAAGTSSAARADRAAGRAREAARVADREQRARAVHRTPKVIPQKTYRGPGRAGQSGMSGHALGANPVGMPSTGMCPACNAPINPVTMECRCSD